VKEWGGSRKRRRGKIRPQAFFFVRKGLVTKVGEKLTVPTERGRQGDQVAGGRKIARIRNETKQ